jgi:hypothetical protein
MMARLIDAIFGCRHSRYSFPVTIRGKARRPQSRCIDWNIRGVPGLRKRISLRLAGDEGHHITVREAAVYAAALATKDSCLKIAVSRS